VIHRPRAALVISLEKDQILGILYQGQAAVIRRLDQRSVGKQTLLPDKVGCVNLRQPFPWSLAFHNFHENLTTLTAVTAREP